MLFEQKHKQSPIFHANPDKIAYKQDCLQTYQKNIQQ